MEENLTKTQASKRIEKLQRKTGRGLAPGEQRSASEEKAEPRSRGWRSTESFFGWLGAGIPRASQHVGPSFGVRTRAREKSYDSVPST